jgi:hypothetical protein
LVTQIENASQLLASQVGIISIIIAPYLFLHPDAYFVKKTNDLNDDKIMGQNIDISRWFSAICSQAHIAN